MAEDAIPIYPQARSPTSGSPVGETVIVWGQDREKEEKREATVTKASPTRKTGSRCILITAAPDSYS